MKNEIEKLLELPEVSNFIKLTYERRNESREPKIVLALVAIAERTSALLNYYRDNAPSTEFFESIMPPDNMVQPNASPLELISALQNWVEQQPDRAQVEEATHFLSQLSVLVEEHISSPAKELYKELTDVPNIPLLHMEKLTEEQKKHLAELIALHGKEATTRALEISLIRNNLLRDDGDDLSIRIPARSKIISLLLEREIWASWPFYQKVAMEIAEEWITDSANM